MKIDAIKEATPEAQPHVIPETKKKPKTGTKVESSSVHKYEIRARTKRINHVTRFQIATKISWWNQKKQ